LITPAGTLYTSPVAPRTETARVSIAKIAASAALLASLAACSLADDYLRPATAIPEGWRNSVAAASEWPSSEWWHRFGSSRLDRMMTDAERANFDLAAAIARVRQADAQLRIAGATLLPSLGASGGGTRTVSPWGDSTKPSWTSAGMATAKSANYANSFNLGLAASYEIDFWGKNRSARDAAAAVAIQSRYDSRTVQLGVQTGLSTTYFDLVGQSERLTVARESVANAESVLAAIRDRVEAGTATALDQAQQESVVAAQRATIPPLEQQIRQDSNALAVLTAKSPEDFTVEPEKLADIALPVIRPGLPSSLLARRPDVNSAEQQLIAANANIGAARAALYPDLSLTTNGGVESIALATLFQPSGLFASVGASLTQVIFDNGRLEGQVEFAHARYDELVEDYKKAVLSAFSDVENALVAVQKTGELEAAQRLNVATSRAAFDIAEARLAAGIVDITTVLNTQRTLFSAEDQLVQARLLHLQAVVGLYRAMGGGWDQPVAAGS